MRTSIASAALLALVAAGCTGEAPTTPGDAAVPPQALIANSKAATRPFTGTCEADYAAPPVVTPPILRHVSVGTCTVSHLGRATLRTEAELNLATGVQVAQATLTAANGDQLHLNSIGTGTPAGPATVTFAGTATVVGGTGRFSNAAGEAAVEGTTNAATGNARFTYDGSVAFDAGDRRRP